MAGRVFVRVVMELSDMAAGTTAWVEDTERTRGMVDGGYWEVVAREAAAVTRAPKTRRTAEPEPVRGVMDVSDTAGPDTDACDGSEVR